jgi:acyl carrier protein
LRAHLKQRCPDYMVPSAFVMLNALPLTPNGKIDRKAVPAPEADGLVRGTYVAPRNATEEVLSKIWCEVLRLDRVGMHDNFFELGGHSLLATRAVVRVRDRLDVELPLRTMFEAPTIAQLAAWISIARTKSVSNIPRLTQQLRASLIPASFAQEQLLHVHRVENPGAAYHIPCLVALIGKLDVGNLERSFDEIVRRHECLRTHFDMVGDAPMQVIDAPSLFRIEVFDISNVSATHRKAKAREIVGELRQTPFNLEAGPLFRVGLLRLSPEEHQLIVVMHHIISDGWSAQVLLRELSALYNAFAQQKPSPLPELPVQYADFAIWQRTQRYSEALEPQIAYWTGRLADASLLNTPLDRPRPDRCSYEGAKQVVTFSPELTVALRKLADREGVTLFMLLFAAYAGVLSCWSRHVDVVIGTPIAGRNQSSLERLIGFFINILPLRIDMSGDPSFREVLKRVKDETLNAFAHPDLPPARLLSELQRKGRSNGEPLYRIVFAMQNVPTEKMSFTGLNSYPLETPAATARRDQTFFLYDLTDRIHGVLEYSTDIFEADTIKRLLEQYTSLLKEGIENPDRRISTMLDDNVSR